MAKISIILPSYNHAHFLKDRLDSILSQTYENWELIIIDDHSTDYSFEILSAFVNQNKSKIKYFIRNEKNSGSGYLSWKKGIELAETEYIWIAETDDYSEPTFLEELVGILEDNKKVSLAFCGSNYVEEDKITYDTTNRMKDLDVQIGKYKVLDGNVFFDKMPFETYITNGSAVVFQKPKGIIPNEIFVNKQCSDIFLWTYLLQENGFVFLNKNLNFFRRHENSTTRIMLEKNMEAIYHEKAFYLNYFKQFEKADAFIEHYIKHYIFNNKFDLFNVSSLAKIKKKRIVQKYFKILLLAVVHKIKTKIKKISQ